MRVFMEYNLSNNKTIKDYSQQTVLDTYHTE